MPSIRKTTPIATLGPLSPLAKSDTPFISGSVFDTQADGGVAAPAPYSDSELSAYPSPSWMGKANDFAFGTAFSMAGNALFPGVGGYLGSLAWNTTKNATSDEGFSANRFGRDAIYAVGNGLLGSLGLGGKVAGAIGSPNQMVNMGVSAATNSITKEGLNSFLGWVTGKLGLNDSPKNDSGKGIGGDWFQGPETVPNTIGNMDYDPAAYDATNLVSTPIGPVPGDVYFSGVNAPPGTYAGNLSDFANANFGNPMGMGDWGGGSSGASFGGGSDGSGGGDSFGPGW